MKQKTRRGIGIFLALSMVFLQLFTMFCGLEKTTVYASNNSPTRIINLVYDDSGSMIETDGVKVDTWCQAKYSMEVFAAMLGKKDTLNVYVMSDFSKTSDEAGPYLTLSGTDGISENVKKIHDMVTEAGRTPFNTVRKAYKDLTTMQADEKWLVVLTDGEFQNIDDIDGFFAEKDDSVNVMFLGMGADADSIKADASKNIYFEKAETSKEILEKITGICTRIFNSDKLDANIISKEFDFDIPMSELVVFAQGNNVKINGVKTAEGVEISGATEPVTVKYSEVATTNEKYQDIIIAKDLQGQIMTFTGDYDPGKYKVDVEGAETIEIYYKPNIEITVYLTDIEGEPVSDMGSIEAGEYVMSFGFVRTGTDEPVNNQSTLLGNVSYSSVVRINGESDGLTHQSGDLVDLQEGTFEVDVTANYLKYNTTSASLSYKVFSNKTLDVKAVSVPKYTITKDGFTNSDEPIQIKVTIEGRDLTQEEWNCLGDLDLQMAEDDKTAFEYTVEKTKTPGIYNIYSKLIKEDLKTGLYDDTDTLNLAVSGKVGEEKWTGVGGTKVEYTDQRSWWDRNKDNVGKLIVAGAGLIFLLGYVPGIKKRLPKKLKKAPEIDIKPNVVGKKRWKARGRMYKNNFRKFLPYVSETATIKFLPPGVGGVPIMKVRAAGSNRMEIVNTKDYADKKDFTIDGLMITKGQKNLKKSAGLFIKYHTAEADYMCSPNK